MDRGPCRRKVKNGRPVLTVLLRPILLLGLLLVASVPGGAQPDPPLEVTLEDVDWSYGPEAWKDDPRFRTSMGSRLDAHVQVRDADEDWQYSATLSDGQQTLAGTVTADGDRVTATFDVDGSRNGIDPVRAPLVPGTWRLRIDASTPGPLPGDSSPEGFGVVPVPAAFVSLQDPQWTRNGSAPMPLPGAPVAAGVLPGIQETGGAPSWFAHPMLRVGDAFLATLATGVPDAPVTWTAWTPAPGLPTEPPFEAVDLGTTTTDAAGRTTLSIGATGTPQLLAVAGVLDRPDGGGAGVLVLGTGDGGPTITAVTAPDTGGTGPLQVTVDQGLLGTAYALRGADGVLSQGPVLLPVGMDSAMALLDPTPIRAAAVPGYDLLVLTGSQGADYTGHHVVQRGLDVALDVPTLGVGQEATVTARFTNPATGAAGASDAAGDAIGLTVPADATLRIHDTPQGNASFQVPPGGTITRTWTWTPTDAGSTPFAVAVDTGDLRFEERTVATVLEPDAYAKQTAPWYDPQRYTPAPMLAPLALVGVALLLRQQKR